MRTVTKVNGSNNFRVSLLNIDAHLAAIRQGTPQRVWFNLETVTEFCRKTGLKFEYAREVLQEAGHDFNLAFQTFLIMKLEGDVPQEGWILEEVDLTDD